jgi:NAD(P)-dependent dehydrogenase (short-subunit alcohol dehydrogenase family)
MNDLKQVNEDSKLEIMSLDLSSLASVRKFAEDIYEQESKIDILINNAGIMMCPKSKTEYGFEMQFQVNYLGIKIQVFSHLKFPNEKTNQ